MIVYKNTLFISILLLLLLMFNSASAGWLLTGKYIGPDGKTYMQRYFIQDGKVKFEQYNIIYTYDSKTESIILVDPENLVFYRNTLSGFIQDMKSYRQKQLEILLKDVPAEQKEKVRETYLAGITSIGSPVKQITDSVIVTRVPDSLRILGMPSEKYLISLKNRKLEELWISPGLNVNKEFSWSKYLNFLALVEPDIPELNFMVSDSYLELLNKGFPSRRIFIRDGYRNEVQVNKMEEKNIPEYEFYTPSLCKQLNYEDWLKRGKSNDQKYDDYE
ncbi:MAG: hypothetical protein IPH88_14520 [Bacteroidales bacterium]|nr:hypothetical protein [Bacteroidales bacterium]